MVAAVAAVLSGSEVSAQTEAVRPADSITIGELAAMGAATEDGAAPATIGEVFRTADDRLYAVVDFGGEVGPRRVGLGRFECAGDRVVLRGVTAADAAALPAHEAPSEGDVAVAADTAISVLGYAAAARGDARISVQALAPQVRVQQAPLSIQVEQPAPQIVVRQPTPQVSVRQLQPIVIVRQGPPTVTVTVPEPEIIVRLPEPEVNVAMAEPKIDVRVPEAQVQVLEQAQPQAAVAAAQPVVSLAKSGGAEVAIQQARPEVSFERLGDPIITVNQSEGQPLVRFERMTAAEALALDPQIAPLATGIVTNLQRPLLLGDDRAEVTVSAFAGREVLVAAARPVGVVADVYAGEGGTALVAVQLDPSVSGDGRQVLVPSDALELRGDRLTYFGGDAAALVRLDGFDAAAAALPTIGGDQAIAFPRGE